MIGLTGISHKTATLEVRELFYLSKEEIILFSELLKKETGISDIIVLSTCNRTEVYYSQSKYDFPHAAKQVYNALKLFKLIRDEHWNAFYNYSDSKAVKHLFKVASGIDSMIIGEDQIVGQIKEAYLLCAEAALTDAILMRLFQKSLEAGKRVRTETRIKLGSTSVSSVAVQKCTGLSEELSGNQVLLIGAGESGNLVVKTLHKSEKFKITITNRTEGKARNISDKYNCTLLPFDQISNNLHCYDIVIVATGSNVPLVTKEMVKESRKRRNSSKQVFIDISVPRNIEKNVEDLTAVQLFTIDDLQEIVNTNMEKRKSSIVFANRIIDQIEDDFSDWVASRTLQPAIKTITSKMLKVSKRELNGYNRSESEEIQQAIHNYSEQLTQKYISFFIKKLKVITANGKKTDAVRLVDEFFKTGDE
ncbi:MAG: glutamyl-tRNA reductase [Bacteroidales bacterium]